MCKLQILLKIFYVYLVQEGYRLRHAQTVRRCTEKYHLSSDFQKLPDKIKTV